MAGQADTATMDFFRHQEMARRRTGFLIGCYVAAVVLIILAVYAAVVLIFFYGRGAGVGRRPDLFDPTVFLAVAGGTLAIILGGTFYKISQLSSGGETVARLLGGRPVNPETTDADERRILNVVEEMAIASGLPVPRVFILDEEDSINAFAAGFTPDDAVIGVTRGCAKLLTRDELQGVIGHEISHILNGDMRLNIRLMGVLHGILVIALIGYGILRTIGRSSSRTRSSSRGRGGAATLAIMLFGLLLMIIGYIGVFFAKLIKSAVSRQREFLADAASVQFTRNPGGIAGALRKIAGWAAGSRLSTEHAEEASHLFFGNALARSWFSLMSTHPPIEERIRRIDPSFDGNIEPVRKRQISPDDDGRPASPAFQAVSGFTAAQSAVRTVTVMAPSIVSQVGKPTSAHLSYAANAIASIPPVLAASARNPNRAAHVIEALLLSDRPSTREIQLNAIRTNIGRESAEAADQLSRHVSSLAPELRLPLADIAVSSLRHMDPASYPAFIRTITELSSADREIDLFEYTLGRMVGRRLAPVFKETRKKPVQYYDLRPLLPHVAKLLSCLAYWGADDQESARKAFEQGLKEINCRADMCPLETCGLQAVDEALSLLEEASPAVKRSVISACAACVGADGTVSVDEAELLRSVADALDCPIPPFLSGLGQAA